MQQPRSIRSQLALVFLFLFLLVVVLGLFSISRLSNFNRLSADVAELWLPNTRVLGDLNNFTSDFRAIEGSDLLSSDPSEIASIQHGMEELDRSIAQAERAYEQLRHDPAERDLYAQFKAKWQDYRTIVNRTLALSHADHKPEAIAAYKTSSRSAYNAASDALGQLTDYGVAKAHAASARLASAYRQAFWLIGLAIVIAGVIVAAALFYISRAISAPLLNLAGRMHRLAVNDTDVEIVGTERRDEIGEMARAAVVFRNNAIELMRSQRVLAQQASILVEKLAHEQRLALQQRNFVSMASHEFRTPLNIIDGHAQRLIRLKDRMQSEEIKERAGKVRGAVLRMTHLIDNLLNSSRLIDSGAEHYFHPAEIDVASLLREVSQLHREMAPAMQIREKFDAAALPMVGDPKLLFQVFSNLLSNAVKYSPDGGPIEISAGIEAGEVVVAFQDRGIGVPEKDLDRLFERYYRGSNVSGIVGTGVGLYLVKMVVDLHGGQIAVCSREGEGSRFAIRLPIQPERNRAVLSPVEAAPAAPDHPEPARPLPTDGR
jgi:two-component system, OmpR family, sensor kinase